MHFEHKVNFCQYLFGSKVCNAIEESVSPDRSNSRKLSVLLERDVESSFYYELTLYLAIFRDGEIRPAEKKLRLKITSCAQNLKNFKSENFWKAWTLPFDIWQYNQEKILSHLKSSFPSSFMQTSTQFVLVDHHFSIPTLKILSILHTSEFHMKFYIKRLHCKFLYIVNFSLLSDETDSRYGI